MKYTLTVLLALLLCKLSFAQTVYSVKGSTADTISNVKLTNATISVLNAKDSTLRAFTRAAADGSFFINKKLGKGKFILLATYPKYADYVEEFTLDSAHATHNFGRISMILKAKLLEGVIVKGTRAAIKIKGDTTEYNASSFTVQPGAKVEDLLKQLPGIQVDKDGKITAQGQSVPKVLVDGEEFFGDDPTLVTKNLRADMVDKVQLYDKSSDQAAFTGIDDGQKTKTINIKLKEDKKNGYFGKADAGIGTKDFYSGQLAVNKFAGKEKMSAYGTIANTGKTGLGWEDANKFGTSNNNVEFNDGGISIFSNSSDEIEGWGGQYSGEGIPKARAGGLHYDNKWNSDKQTINGNYKIGSLGVVGTRNTQTQNNLPSGTVDANGDQSFVKTNSDSRFNNYIFRQKLDAAYTLKIDSLSNLKFTLDGTLKNTETETNSLSTSTRENGSLLNRNDNRLNVDGDQKTFNFSALYTKKFKKAGRTLSVNISESLDRTNNTGFLFSDIDIYDESGTQTSGQLTDQRKVNTIKSNMLNSNITYTEPFSKYFSLMANYGIGVSSSDADRRSLNRASNGEYTLLDPLLSNHYQLDQLTNQTGAIFNYKKDKTTFNFGTKVAFVKFGQENMYTGEQFDRNFTNWNPQATYQYRFSQQKSFRFNYNGNTRQPTIDQIQPIRNNNDPLNLVVGNPGLTPSFTNRFQVSYNSYKVLSNRSVWINGSYSLTSNPIVSNVNFDRATGISTRRYSNLSGETPTSFNLYAQTDMKVKFLFGMNVGVNVSTNGNTSFNQVTQNGIEQTNRTRNNTYQVGLNLSRYVEKKFDFYANFGPSYNTSVSSLNPNTNNNGRGFNGFHYLNVYLPLKVQLGAEGEYQYRAATQTFNEDFSRYLLTLNLTKSFFKEQNLKVRINVNDVFNQNQGFSRNASGNYITQNSYTTIKRYFLFSLIYEFNKMGGGAPKQ
ncbi:outer membrane beta-barrel family protein [uncultured Mucilaginibacter sp.]|uniref:outer membrane beta-barrel family protein n=1 Tax=uncultured Mucilaginibacter sp. TaxID=797541 RepID=UPI0025D6BDB1|nr:outer membrane beta-barrel family protein [uncultured Mucilaginibacter sp.]